METFNDYLVNLLVNCRETAFDELRLDKRYAEMEQEQSALQLKLEAISPEAEKLVEQYFNAVVGVHGMECNAAQLSGITFSSELRKRFDSSTPEYQALAKEYL